MHVDALLRTDAHHRQVDAVDDLPFRVVHQSKAAANTRIDAKDVGHDAPRIMRSIASLISRANSASVSASSAAGSAAFPRVRLCARGVPAAAGFLMHAPPCTCCSA